MSDTIAVCIPTFRRPVLLGRLLRSILFQQTGGLFGVSVVVVDNDPDGSAHATVEKYVASAAIPIDYAIEPDRSIPTVRNRALQMSSGNFIAIIDDDEFAPRNWLLQLYSTLHTFEVDGVLGPVRPFFDQTPPDWLIKSGLCERPEHRTGTILQWHQTRTGNVLLRRAVFDEHNLRFDETFKTGGSDREFFKKAIGLGYRFAAAQEAPVYEIVPRERWRKSYWIRRAAVNGYNANRNARGLAKWPSRLFLPFQLLASSLIYAAAMPILACIGTHALMRGVESGVHHFSRLCGLLGITLVKQRDF